MKYIVGLGNVGKRFELIRHSIGFEVTDYILEKNNLSLDKQKFKGIYTIKRMNGDKVLLIESMTMMNLLDEAVTPIMNYYNVNPESLTVLYDDLDLEQGQVRLRQEGSADGHDGIESITEILGTDQLKRIRIGVGRPTNGMVVPGCASQRFSDDGVVTTEEVIEHAARAIEEFVETSRFDHVMDEFNGEMK